MNSHAQQLETEHNNRRPKRGESYMHQSGDKAPIYQQELAYAFKSAKKNSASKNLGNIYSLTQIRSESMHNSGSKKANQQRGRFQHKPNQSQQYMNSKANMSGAEKQPHPPTRSYKNQYKFMMLNNHRQQQQQPQKQRYLQSNSNGPHRINNEIMGFHDNQQAKPPQEAFINMPSLPQMPELPLAMHDSLPNLLDGPEQGPVEIYMPM